MAHNAPGRHYRDGITLMQLADMFHDEVAAREWFEARVWSSRSILPPLRKHQDAERRATPNRPIAARIAGPIFRSSRGSLAEASKACGSGHSPISWRRRSLKGISSMKLHRDIGVTQKTAWFMLHRIRLKRGREMVRAYFPALSEVDETYMGGKDASTSTPKISSGLACGPVGKTAVVGAKDRKTNKVRALRSRRQPNTDAKTLQQFVADTAAQGATASIPTTQRLIRACPMITRSVRHSVGEYVDGMAHTNGLESFWSMLKRAHKGTFHKISPKRSYQRYVNEFCARHNMRDQPTIVQMRATVADMVGKRLTYKADSMMEDVKNADTFNECAKTILCLRHAAGKGIHRHQRTAYDPGRR